ncbi:uncharacterized protein PGTG_19848 [Puccinia graminis f. sp. tritici CRL 75-36-700-3]|uniref:Uncharacterized protein n=1 Tax=Puccinia graminis f. sp. tritici (strain CRL 75-36-700-3 / race SCCL) TaxID=418459 RepID=E3LBI4_PUCGT|nr:uncharacterized protein PGTG_19848 [Puccinia graminis f. sp. tritici CRL 75-36-700-3]EFP93909.2 hypothetical protein PGTG_19848 [Puccinia graminis f. sp. tritici CRL 75-36-700-3]
MSMDLNTATTRMTCDTVNPSLIRFRPNSTDSFIHLARQHPFICLCSIHVALVPSCSIPYLGLPLDSTRSTRHFVNLLLPARFL